MPTIIYKKKTFFGFFLSDKVDNNQVEDDVAKDEVGEAAFRTDAAELILVGRINLFIR
jgi:hypothetical protein